MDMQVICSYTSGEITFNSAKLKTATDKIVKKISQSKSAFASAGAELEKIKNDKLYSDDFESFKDYVENVFGISQAKAYKIISTSKKLIAPELEKTSEPYFLNYSESALTTLIAAGDSHDDIVQFCERNNITEFSPVADIRSALKSEKEDSTEKVPEEVETEAETETETETEESPEIEALKALVQGVRVFILGGYDKLEQERDKKAFKSALNKTVKAVKEMYNI